MLHASGGAMRRTDLARAFALRSQPDLITRIAPPALAGAAQTWASRVGQRSAVPGLLVGALKALSDRNGVDLTTDASSHSLVRINSSTPTDNQIDPWFRFEARLACQVLTALSVQTVRTIDAAITGGDRSLLELVS
jgi:hypothetical protein